MSKSTEDKAIPDPAYSTHIVGSSPENGSWEAELRKDGVPYGRVHVHSISALLARSKINEQN